MLAADIFSLKKKNSEEIKYMYVDMKLFKNPMQANHGL